MSVPYVVSVLIFLLGTGLLGVYLSQEDYGPALHYLVKEDCDVFSNWNIQNWMGTSTARINPPSQLEQNALNGQSVARLLTPVLDNVPVFDVEFRVRIQAGDRLGLLQIPLEHHWNKLTWETLFWIETGNSGTFGSDEGLCFFNTDTKFHTYRVRINNEDLRWENCFRDDVLIYQQIRFLHPFLNYESVNVGLAINAQHITSHLDYMYVTLP